MTAELKKMIYTQLYAALVCQGFDLSLPKPAILFRFDPKQCKNELVRPYGDTLFTKGINLQKAGITDGSIVFVLASGDGKDRGMLRICEVDGEPFYGTQDIEQVHAFTPSYKPMRMEDQWHIRVHDLVNVHAIHGDNLDRFKSSPYERLRWLQIPHVLSEDETRGLLRMYWPRLT